jgi:hypothetical protein
VFGLALTLVRLEGRKRLDLNFLGWFGLWALATAGGFLGRTNDNYNFRDMCSIDPGTMVTTLNIPLIGIVTQLQELGNPWLTRTLLATLQLAVPEG